MSIDWNQYDTDYERWLGSRAGQDATSARQESTDWTKTVRQQDVDYRDRALAQQGSASRASSAASKAATAASRANAQLAAKTQLKTTQMQIDASYRQMRERLNELEIPTLNLDIWYKQQQVGLAKANLALEARAPRNALQYSSAMGQLEGNGYVPASIAAIARNQPAVAFSGQSGSPEPLTYDALAKQYGLDGGGGSSTDTGTSQTDAQRENAVLDAIKLVANRGPQGQAPGTLESLTSYDREILASGLERLGYDYNDFVERYQRALPGQGSATAA